jgi:hypothetical protein
MIWDELCKLALIGTDRLALSGQLQHALGRVGVLSEENPAQQVLEGAAVYYNLQRAGFPLAALPLAEVEEVIISFPGHARRPATEAASRFLQIILSGRYSKALSECLSGFQKSAMRLPAEQLPTLFELSLGRPWFWKKIRPLLDARAYWLLLQNPAWQSLAIQPDTGKWAEGEGQRAAILRYLRHTQPEKAAAFLESNWEELPYTEKKNLLVLLEPQLTSADAPLLQRALNDSRKEVRMEAGRLSGQIPDSEVQRALKAMGADILSVDATGKLKVELPSTLTEEMKAVGIDDRISKYKGRRPAARAYEILRRIPPAYWEEYFKKSIVDLLRMAGGNAYGPMILQAIGQAALSFSDARWSASILRYWWRQQEKKQWTSALGKALMKHLPEPVFNEMIVQHFQQEAGYLEEDSFINHLILTGGQQWEDHATRLILQGFQQWVNTAQSYYWNLWHYKRIFRVAAYKANPALLDRYSKGWDARSPVWTNWEPSVESMLKTWAFRKDMRKAFPEAAKK